MIYVKIKDRKIPASVSGRVMDHEWDGRASKSITCELTHDEAATLFVDGVAWSIIQEKEPYTDNEGNTVTPEPVEFDNSDYCVAGDITDHRDGTISVKMGKLTDLEEAYTLLYGGDK